MHGRIRFRGIYAGIHLDSVHLFLAVATKCETRPIAQHTQRRAMCIYLQSTHEESGFAPNVVDTLIKVAIFGSYYYKPCVDVRVNEVVLLDA